MDLASFAEQIPKAFPVVILRLIQIPVVLILSIQTEEEPLIPL